MAKVPPVPDFLLNIESTKLWAIEAGAVAPVVKSDDQYWYSGKDGVGDPAGNYPTTWLESFTPLYRHPGPYDPDLMTVGRWCECRDGMVRQVNRVTTYDNTGKTFCGFVGSSVNRKTGRVSKSDKFSADVIHILITEAEKEAVEAMTRRFHVMVRGGKGGGLLPTGAEPFTYREDAEQAANECASVHTCYTYVVLEEISEHTAEQPKPVVNVTRFRS